MGMRNMVIPGQRIQTTVVTMLTAPRMVPRPDTIRPTAHRSPPDPGERTASDSGVYPVHPKSAAPPGTTNPASTSSPPNRNSQNDSALSRGKATSGAPICRGSTRFAKPKTTGVAYNSSITVPCTVNSWLYCSLDRNCSPGIASSVRISSAMIPALKKNANDAARYIWPINLWSVVLTSPYSTAPKLFRRAGYGRPGVNGTSTAVTRGRYPGRSRAKRCLPPRPHG
ncbi:Uncharacterised protein [Mycobacteroides abscessus subsp. abscessus]|nr:Uncharacterised protein [Mycobacteroides abscessus subsp. abscessus]